MPPIRKTTNETNGRQGLPLSPYMKLVNEWKDCTRCRLHETRTRVCFARGNIPATIALVGEAPGASEDAQGVPFWGPAGDLLEQIVNRAIPSDMTRAYLNLVGCIPLDDGMKGEPDDKCVTACQPLLKSLLKIINPRLIVCVGKLSQEKLLGMRGYKAVLQDWYQGQTISIDHPAYILRASVASKSFLAQRGSVTIRQAVGEMDRVGKAERFDAEDDAPQSSTDSDIPF